MCGIVGIIQTEANRTKPTTWKNGHYQGQVTPDAQLYIEQALLCDMLRGADATGLAVIAGWENVEIYKRALCSYDFLNSPKTLALLETVGTSVGVIGHNRKATIGKKDDESSHPFSVGDIVLVHNGTVNQASALLPSVYANKHVPCSVDSAYIAAAIAESSNPITVLEQLVGSYALLWYNKLTGLFYVARNKERPLGFVMQEDKSCMYIASEYDMATWITNRNAISTEDTPYIFEENILYTINPETLDMTTEKYSPFVPKQYQPPAKTWGAGAQSQASSSIPKVEKGKSKIKKRLKKIGIEWGRNVCFQATLFNPLVSNATRGHIEGVVGLGEKARPGVMYNIERKLALQAIDFASKETPAKGYIKTKVVGLSSDNKTLILDGNDIVCPYYISSLDKPNNPHPIVVLPQAFSACPACGEDSSNTPDTGSIWIKGKKLCSLCSKDDALIDGLMGR